MNASEMMQIVSKKDELKGIEFYLDERRNQVEANGFHLAKDWKVAKEILVSLGFECLPNNGMWRGAVESKGASLQSERTPEQDAALREHLEKMARS